MSFISKLLNGADSREAGRVLAKTEAAEGQTPAPKVEKLEPETSTIGKLAKSLMSAHQSLSTNELNLSAEITALIEERRQVRKSLDAVRNGLMAINEDPALTNEESNKVKVALDELPMYADELEIENE